MSECPGRVPRAVHLLVAAAALLACSTAQPIIPPSDGRVALGTWGGDSGGLIAGDTATHVHIGCTFGDVTGRIPVDSRGRFSVAGRYMLRATNTGMTAVIDQRGVVVKAAPEFETATVEHTVPGYEGATPYVRWGNGAFLVLTLLMLLLVLRTSRVGIKESDHA